MLPLLLLCFVIASFAEGESGECNFPLSGQGSCTHPASTQSEFVVNFIEDIRFPSCLDIHFVVSSSSDYEFTYDLHEAYNLEWFASDTLLLTVIAGCSDAFKPSIFLSLVVYALCMLLGFPTSTKRSLLLIGVLAFLPVALLCTTTPSTLTIGVPANLVSGGWKTEVYSLDEVTVFADATELSTCDCGSDCIAVLSCGSSSSVNSQTCSCTGTVTCPTGCATCSSATVCTSCTSGYYLAAGLCFQGCTPACDASHHCVEGQCLGTGTLFFSIAWEFPGDADLYVTTPLGHTINFVQKSADGGFLDYDDTEGRGPENVFWTGTPPSGTYRVCVDDYEGNTPDFYIPQTVTYYLNSNVPRTKRITQSVDDLYTSDSTAGNACTSNSPGYLGSYTY